MHYFIIRNILSFQHKLFIKKSVSVSAIRRLYIWPITMIPFVRSKTPKYTAFFIQSNLMDASIHRRPRLTMWGVIIIFLILQMPTFSETWRIYRRLLLFLHDDRVWLRETWPSPGSLLCYRVVLQRFNFTKGCMEKTTFQLKFFIYFCLKNYLPQCLDVFSIVVSLLGSIRSLLSVNSSLCEPGAPGNIEQSGIE